MRAEPAPAQSMEIGESLRRLQRKDFAGRPGAGFITAHQPCFGCATGDGQMWGNRCPDRLKCLGSSVFRNSQVWNHRGKGSPIWCKLWPLPREQVRHPNECCRRFRVQVCRSRKQANLDQGKVERPNETEQPTKRTDRVADPCRMRKGIQERYVGRNSMAGRWVVKMAHAIDDRRGFGNRQDDSRFTGPEPCRSLRRLSHRGDSTRASGSVGVAGARPRRGKPGPGVHPCSGSRAAVP